MLRTIKKLKIILIIDLLIYIICLIGFSHLNEKAAIRAIFEQKGGNVSVKEIKSPYLKNSLKKDDLIITLNSYKISAVEDIEFICSMELISSTIPVEINRNGEQFSLLLLLEPFFTRSYLIIVFIVGNFFFFLGIFVLLKRPDDRVAQVFHWSLISVTTLCLANWATINVHPYSFEILVRILFSIAYAFFPPIFIHLSLIFPKIKWQSYKKLLIPLYCFSILLSFLQIITFIFSILPVSITGFHYYMNIFDITRYYFVLSGIFGVINFLHSYSKALEKSERHKLQWVILGLTIGTLSFVLLWQIPQLITSYELIPEEIMLLLVAIAPLTIAISIVKYQMMDIELIFNRSTVYILVITILMIIYTSIVALAAIAIGTLTLKVSLIVSAVSAIIVAILFEPARRSIQLFVDKKFFHVRYNYRLAQTKISNTMERLSRLIKNILDFSKMERGVKEYNFAEANLIKVIGNVINSMKYQLQQYNFKVTLKLSKKVPTIIADTDALIQALTNLISNAIKYSKKEKYLGIRTSIDNKFALIDVKDKGIGIPKNGSRLKIK